MKKRYALLLVTALTLSGCVDRKMADAKLTRGCAAGAELFMTDGFKIKEIKQTLFNDSSELGPTYRVVNVTAVVSDGWANIDKEIKCIFTESYGFLGMSYNAQIYQLKFDDKTYGQEGHEILGTYDENLKLTETVDTALMQ